MEWMSLVLFATLIVLLMAGYPVAFTLAGVSIIFAFAGSFFGIFDMSFLNALPNRLYGIMTNGTLIAVPLFVFMGVMLQKTKLAENLLESMALLFGQRRGGLGFSVIIVGMLLAASTGIVGATVVTMGLMSLPTMLKRGYDPALSCGVICASGTLGQIIPPSIVLILLADVLSNAYQQAQLQMGIFSPKTVTVSDLFTGAIGPGLLLVFLYMVYLVGVSIFQPEKMPVINATENNISKQEVVQKLAVDLLPTFILIMLVLGSILTGKATPTEASALGASGALLIALIKKQLTLSVLKEVMQSTTQVTSMVFMIFIGAAFFSLVFKGFGGDELVQSLLTNLPGGKYTALFIVMAMLFLLGFVLDFIEITFVVVPIIGPALLMMGIDPIWLGILIAVNLQTSFLTPPFGFALFYLRGVAPKSVKTKDIYKGIVPFIFIQLLVLLLIALFPSLVSTIPSLLK